MKKIRTFEESRISIDNGYGELHIAETNDGTFNIRISETVDNKLRIGIKNEHGTTYIYWSQIETVMNDYENGDLTYNRQD